MSKNMFSESDLQPIVETNSSGYYKYEGIVKSKKSNFRFMITCVFQNGTPLGFDYNHCISVLSPIEGVWKHVADASTIYPQNEKRVSYVSSPDEKVEYKNAFVTACIKYLNLVYGY